MQCLEDDEEGGYDEEESDCADGHTTDPVDQTGDYSRLRFLVEMSEGRNRQIRKMCEALGLEVARLKRTAIGPVKLGMLQPGQWRELTPDEMRSIRNYHNKLLSRHQS